MTRPLDERRPQHPAPPAARAPRAVHLIAAVPWRHYQLGACHRHAELAWLDWWYQHASWQAYAEHPLWSRASPRCNPARAARDELARIRAEHAAVGRDHRGDEVHAVTTKADRARLTRAYYGARPYHQLGDGDASAHALDLTDATLAAYIQRRMRTEAPL